MLVVGVEVSEPLVRGDLSVRLVKDRLELPMQYALRMKEYNCFGGYALEFISYIQSAPSAVAAALGWTPQEAKNAYAIFCAQFTRVFPEKVLHPDPFIRGTGAMPTPGCKTPPGYKV